MGPNCYGFLTSCQSKFEPSPEIAELLPEQVDFNYHIKPLLSDRCYACHGPDENKRETDLRLDIEDGAFNTKLSSGGRAIVPSSLNRSHIWERINNTDPEEMMPPPESNLSLNEYEIALIGKWIEQGAEWKPHWSFIPPEKPSLPEVDKSEWTKNPIDNFTLSNLEKLKVEPEPEADKERLLRRVTMDLTGLPPTIEEIDAFLNDGSPVAYEKVVDRLLATDAYAERMAMEWMDVARYADSHGLHADGWRLMWPWRDWVIKAFKENMPYDEFITLQLAGDLLPNATQDQKLATAFHRNHPMTAEGGAVDEEFRLEYVFDRANTTATAFLGLTMECARCHDHKFDPISQKEYFQLSAFFNNVKELGMTGDDGNYGPHLLLHTKETQEALDVLNEKIAKTEEKLDYSDKEIKDLDQYIGKVRNPKMHAHFPLDQIVNVKIDGKDEKRLDGNRKGQVNGEPEVVDGKIGKAVKFDSEYDLLQLSDAGVFEWTEPFSAGAWVKTGKSGENQSIFCTTGNKNNFWRGWEFYIDSLNRPSIQMIHSLPHNYLHVGSDESIKTNEWVHIMFTYEGTGKAKDLNLYIDGKKTSTIVKYDQLYKSIYPVTNSSHLPDPKRTIQVGKSRRAFTGENGIFEGIIDDIRVYKESLTPLEVANLVGVEIDPQDNDMLREHHFKRDNNYQVQMSVLKKLLGEKLDLLNTVSEVMVMEEMSNPRPTFILDRGQYDAPTERVFPGTPESVLSFSSDLEANRLGLAKWVVSDDNPLTARVAVNRYWQLFFGRGIVKTPQDFGNQGSLPSHPKLLDWLAVNFIESGWDIKALNKLIVTSATYRQSSMVAPEKRDLDPENKLLARGPSYRLQAEMIRDNALASSGLLVNEVGGKSVKPYQPDSLWIEKGSFSHILLNYKHDKGDDLYRRSMYTFIRRTSPPPAMTVFDQPTRSVCTVKRETTNTPLQALVLMNDPQFVEAARVLAERMQKESGPEVNDQVTYGFRLLTGRKPVEQEVAVFANLYELEKDKYEQDPKSAVALLNVGEFKTDPSLTKTETAALTTVASMMMNHDEAYMKR